MSHSIDFMNFIKGQLTRASTKLQSQTPPDRDTAGRLGRIVASAEFISSGHWLVFEKLYEPFSPKLQRAVKNLNDDLISGRATALTFDEYISLLVEKLNQPVTP